MKLYRVMVEHFNLGLATGRRVLNDYCDFTEAKLRATVETSRGRHIAYCDGYTENLIGGSVAWVEEVEGFGCGRVDEGMRRASREAYTECGGRWFWAWGGPPFPEVTSRAIQLQKLLPIESPAERVCSLGGSKGEAGVGCQE